MVEAGKQITTHVASFLEWMISYIAATILRDWIKGVAGKRKPAQLAADIESYYAHLLMQKKFRDVLEELVRKGEMSSEQAEKTARGAIALFVEQSQRYASELQQASSKGILKDVSVEEDEVA